MKSQDFSIFDLVPPYEQFIKDRSPYLHTFIEFDDDDKKKIFLGEKGNFILKENTHNTKSRYSMYLTKTTPPFCYEMVTNGIKANKKIVISNNNRIEFIKKGKIDFYIVEILFFLEDDSKKATKGITEGTLKFPGGKTNIFESNYDWKLLEETSSIFNLKNPNKKILRLSLFIESYDEAIEIFDNHNYIDCIFENLKKWINSEDYEKFMDDESEENLVEKNTVVYESRYTKIINTKNKTSILNMDSNEKLFKDIREFLRT